MPGQPGRRVPPVNGPTPKRIDTRYRHECRVAPGPGRSDGPWVLAGLCRGPGAAVGAEPSNQQLRGLNVKWLQNECNQRHSQKS